ncbi:MAG TPA: FISUMP domain-containing protein [Paludibacter sp.]|nr:FISUMP domain-containing protein [Paludibacter sp.]
MKKIRNLKSILTAFCFVFVATFNSFALNFTINFTGSGAGTTVDSVVVQNLYKSTQVTIPAGTQLRLYDVETSININTITDFACVYPNPMTDNSTFSFVAKNDGKTQIAVYSLDGRKVAGLDADLQQGKNSFKLTLSKGVYLVEAKGNGFSYSTKTISLRLSDCLPIICFNGNLPDSKPKKAPVPIPEVKLLYSPGDQILYKGYSGNYCTIVTDKASESKTVDFKFVDCTDADGNHYAVVHIGTQTWMAENLKTTKYQNGETIGTTIPATKNISSDTDPKYQWAYNGVENNLAKYGRLYTWYAAADARNIAPAGWHVAFDTEWSTLENYLIANGYNYDGTITGNKTAKALAATTDWLTDTTLGAIGNELTKNNSSGFTALPSGFRYDDGRFREVGEFNYWWSSNEEYATIGRYLYLCYVNTYPKRVFWNKAMGCSLRCIMDDLPTLTTSIVTNIDPTTAVSGGKITMKGNSDVTARGVCWSKNHNPTIADNLTSDGWGIGTFSSNLSGLSSGEIYYLRAFATNSKGTAYGNEVSFSTTIKDIDGNHYKVVKIGTQTWMAENLKTTKYQNGEAIGTTNPANKDVSGETAPKYQWAYNDNDSNVTKYGRLYTWYAVVDTRNIAPVGWHVPTDAEWTQLENYMIVNGYNYDGSHSGNKIAKALAATTDWTEYINTGTIGYELSKNNKSGFTALPGGIRGTDGSFSNGSYLGAFGYSGCWWSSTENSFTYPWIRHLEYYYVKLDRAGGEKGAGFSVRCVKDE